ncbi:MAG: L,D-transpeptidase [Bdellovibrionaceae bacterium]|nr:L,D-transpeptidase [Pseudobdellovibrionaceae bacterium]MBX3034024.1 L,D-transpeptidase [Pseudobdellovibrionaceae bacterium]
MPLKALFLTLFTSLTLGATAWANDEIEELNPYDADIEETLQRFDAEYERATGLPSHLEDDLMTPMQGGCYRETCYIWAHVNKASQTMNVYIEGRLTFSWAVSTGLRGRTPNFDTHPSGRVYDRYTSTKFPGGNYRGLGNMPYAVFIRGGFAIHGTPEGNWRHLGRPASHGCIRLHPDNGYAFNRLVRSVGARRVWITVN